MQRILGVTVLVYRNIFFGFCKRCETQGTDTPVKPFSPCIRSEECMRRARFKTEASVQVARYRCVFKVVDSNATAPRLKKRTEGTKANPVPSILTPRYTTNCSLESPKLSNGRPMRSASGTRRGQTLRRRLSAACKQRQNLPTFGMRP